MLDATVLRPDTELEGTDDRFEKWIQLEIGDAHYALPIESVSEVARTRSAHLIPLVRAEIAGVVSLKGEPLLVFNAGTLLQGVPTLRNRHVLVMEGASQRLGVLVDHVDRVLRIAPTQAEIPEAEGDSAAGPDFVTWRRIAERSVGMIDPGAFLGSAEASLRVEPQLAEPKGELPCPNAF